MATFIIFSDVVLNLFLYLELSGFYDLTISVFQLVNINSPAVTGQVYSCPVRNIWHLDHFPAKEVIDLKNCAFLHCFLELNIDESGSGIWIESDETR